MTAAVDAHVGSAAGVARAPAAAPPGHTALLQAVEALEAEKVETLLSARADPCVVSPKGVSPLHVAAFHGSLDTLSRLVAARANVNACDRHGQTPIFFAGNRDICSTLESAGADVNLRNRKGQSALHLAARAGLDDVVGWLAGQVHPGLVNAQDRHGRTALYFAKSSGLGSTAQILQDHGASSRIQPNVSRQQNHQQSQVLSRSKRVVAERSGCEHLHPSGLRFAAIPGADSSVSPTSVGIAIPFAATGLEDEAECFLRSLRIEDVKSTTPLVSVIRGAEMQGKAPERSPEEEAEIFLKSLMVAYEPEAISMVSESAVNATGVPVEDEAAMFLDNLETASRKGCEALEMMSLRGSAVSDDFDEAKSALSSFSSKFDELKQVMMEAASYAGLGVPPAFERRDALSLPKKVAGAAAMQDVVATEDLVQPSTPASPTDRQVVSAALDLAMRSMCATPTSSLEDLDFDEASSACVESILRCAEQDGAADAAKQQDASPTGSAAFSPVDVAFGTAFSQAAALQEDQGAGPSPRLEAAAATTDSRELHGIPEDTSLVLEAAALQGDRHAGSSPVLEASAAADHREPLSGPGNERIESEAAAASARPSPDSAGCERTPSAQNAGGTSSQPPLKRSTSSRIWASVTGAFCRIPTLFMRKRS